MEKVITITASTNIIDNTVKDKFVEKEYPTLNEYLDSKKEGYTVKKTILIIPNPSAHLYSLTFILEERKGSMEKVVTITTNTNIIDEEVFVEKEYPILKKYLKEGYRIKDSIPIIPNPLAHLYSLTFILEKRASFM